MPIIPQSSYPGAPRYQINGHWQTIAPAVLRRIRGIKYQRERLTLQDGDFVDLDWLGQGSKDLVLLSHGLEGNSERHYVKGMAKLFYEKGWDALAWNCRSCSGEMNRKLRLYNHGEIGDISEVIEHALKTRKYDRIVLVGFSMGGNILLKYLGVNGTNIPQQIKKAVAFSAPCDLHTSVALLDRPESSFYRNRFMKMLKRKIKIKARKYPDVLKVENFKKIKEWRDFDNFFSAPLNGYRDADDFYTQGSAANFMEGIKIPTLLVNAQNDPILTPACSPQDLCQDHPFIYLETPEQGGHVGFSVRGKPYAWSEYRAWEFVESGI